MTEKQQKAFKYYKMGLNSKEIGKLLDISYKTVQYYASKFQWKKKKQISKMKIEILHAYELGTSYKDLAKDYNGSRATIYNYLKEARNFKKRKK